MKISLVLVSLLTFLVIFSTALKPPSLKRQEEISPVSRFKSLDKLLNRLDGNNNLNPTSVKTSSSGDGRNPALSYREQLLADRRGVSHFDKLESRNDGLLDDEDFDEDEDESYEDDVDENETDVLNDNTAQWNLSYKSGSYRNKYRSNGQYPPQQQSPPTTTSTTTTTPPPSYSQMKWRDLGGRQAVEQTRLRHSYANPQHNPRQNSRTNVQPQAISQTALNLFLQNALKVNNEGSCKSPKPRLVRVQDFYPHPGKTYAPRCTILHQCSDDTGCCPGDLTCSPKNTQRVELYFYAILEGNSRGATVEKLVFYNHTSCECRDHNEDLMPRDVPSSSFQPKNSLHSSAPLTRSTKPNQCKCPSKFTERILGDGGCTCDCFDKEKECLLLKKGTEFFTMQDKWCIQSGRCEVPGCSYGSYIHLVGRCPRKIEKYGKSLSWHRYLTQ